MDFKKNSVEQALDDLVTKCHGGRWLKIMETKPTPLFHLFVFRGIPDHTRSYNDPEFTASQIHSWLSHLGVQLFGLQAACSKSNPGIKNLKGELDTGAGRFFAAAKMIIEIPQPRTTSSLESGIEEYRRRTQPMDDFKSFKGAANFLRIWLSKENARIAKEDWLKAVVNQ